MVVDQSTIDPCTMTMSRLLTIHCRSMTNKTQIETWLQNIQSRSMLSWLDTRYSHRIYNVDPCQLCTTLHRNLRIDTYSSEYLTIQGIYFDSKWYDSNHVNRCPDVEHGRNNLISSHWCIFLTSVREIAINVIDSQSISVHFSERE